MTSEYELSMNRDVWCILGLPFDSVTMSGAVNIIHSSIGKKIPCFISTPNLNFLIESQKDKDFRNSVINSDLSVADGKPIVWMAKLLGIPITERVAGSDLIETMIENSSKNTPIKTFFFGGEEGIAEIACNKLKSDAAGLKCEGYLNPGFGTIDEMSSTKIIVQINQSNADFIIVSLGAKKGQAWIERNRETLNAPIICHLGAVVNFIAGTINRSPKILQKLGLEWLWRIKEEPLLWKRYLLDGYTFLSLFIFKIVPLFFIIRFNENKIREQNCEVKNKKVVNIELRGTWGKDNSEKITNVFINALNSTLDVNIIIKKDSYVDSSFIAKVVFLRQHLKNKRKQLNIIIESKLVRKIFYYNCCDYLLRKDSEI